MPKLILANSLLLAAALLLPAGITGCTGAGLSQSSRSLPEAQREALLAGASLDLSSPAHIPAVRTEGRDIIAVDSHMRAFIDQRIDRSRNASHRLDALIAAVLGAESFGLDYAGHTRTAAETFRLKNGNCLAFTNMFVAMARDIGLDATFQEVDTPPSWERVGDTMVVSRHVNVLVRKVRDPEAKVRTVMGKWPTSDRVIDFNLSDFRSFYPRRAISDERAFAQYFSNRGVEYLQAHDAAMAMAYFRRALELDPEYAPSWTNIGVVYSRAGKLQDAESAYRQSLAIGESMATRHNLAIVLQASGNQAEAETLQAEVATYRETNPYYRYQQGLWALERNDVERAQSHFEFALEAVPQEHRFNHAMGVVMYRQAHREAARNYIETAKSLAEEPLARERYDAKLQMLVSKNNAH